MNNSRAFCTLATLAVLLGKEFLDWVWWYNWDDGDEENPAPVLCVTWGIWRCLRDAYSWLCSKLWHPTQRWLMAMWQQIFPPEPCFEPMDRDARTPTEWFFIEAIGVWGMERWYKDEYDWDVKRKWDEFLESRDAAQHAEAQQPSAATAMGGWLRCEEPTPKIQTDTPHADPAN